jgi:hypothetical protein
MAKAKRRAGSTQLGMALINLGSIAYDVNATVDLLQDATAQGARAPLAPRLHAYLILQLHCFIEALRFAAGEVRKAPAGETQLKRLSCVTREFYTRAAVIEAYRNQIIAHGGPRSGLEHQAVRIAKLKGVPPYGRVVFLGRLALRLCQLLWDAYPGESLEGDREYSRGYFDARQAAVQRFVGTPDDLPITEVEAEIHRVLARVPPQRTV